VREGGFEYEGQRYRSLTVIAEQITGAHWSGPRFFGVTRRARASLPVKAGQWCEAFISSQRHEGWVCLGAAYDDGGFSGATMDRPALKRLLTDITAGRVDTIVVYKIDRLTRSLADFAKIVASSKCVTVDGRHGSAPGRKDTPRAARSCQQDERSPLDRYGSAWKPRRRPKCAFSDGYWRERLL
jgi:hypothetical protein